MFGCFPDYYEIHCYGANCLLVFGKVIKGKTCHEFFHFFDGVGDVLKIESNASSQM